MRWKTIIFCATVVVQAGLLGTATKADTGNNDAPETRLFVVDASVSAFVDTLTTVSGVRIDVSENVRGRIRRQLFEGTAEDILDALAVGRDLEWFHFNNVYYVSQSGEATSRVVRLGKLSPDTATEVIEGAGLVTQALSQTTTPNGEAIVLTGPPKLVAFAEIIIESIPDVQPVEPQETQIRVRRGNSLAVEPTIEVTTEVVPTD